MGEKKMKKEAKKMKEDSTDPKAERFLTGRQLLTRERLAWIDKEWEDIRDQRDIVDTLVQTTMTLQEVACLTKGIDQAAVGVIMYTVERIEDNYDARQALLYEMEELDSMDAANDARWNDLLVEYLEYRNRTDLSVESRRTYF